MSSSLERGFPIRLIGGWGYDNLGDEAILRGYVDFLVRSGFSPEVMTNSDERTRLAQSGAGLDAVTLASPRATDLPERAPTLLCGGGYLNRRWRGHFERQVLQLWAMKHRSSSFATHAVELNGLREDGISRKLVSVLSDSPLAVRDELSQVNAASVGIHDVDVTCDGISLLNTTVRDYATCIPELHDKCVVNFLDIAGRGDRDQSLVDPAEWSDFVSDFAAQEKGNIIGLRVGMFDELFMRQFGFPILEPRTVVQLTSAIASAGKVLSTRMHPALVATQLGIPTVAVPYCAKVLPTLRRLGVDRIVLRKATLDTANQIMGSPQDFRKQWSDNERESIDWLTTHALDPARFGRVAQ